MNLSRRQFLKLSLYGFLISFLTPLRFPLPKENFKRLEIFKRKPLRVIPCESVSYSHRKLENRKLLEVI